MLMSQELLFDKLIENIDRDMLPADVSPKTLATIRTKFNETKRLSVSFGLLCKLACAAEIDPAIAVLSLLSHRLREKQGEREGRDFLDDKELAARVHEKLTRAAEYLDQQGLPTKTPCKKSFAHFPHAFQTPFFVITGDRRETSGKLMTPADFGAAASSTADLRFLYRLGLPPSTTIITDKVFVLAPYSELQRRFADATLICIGSPASNHLSRILNRYAIHRYNLSKDHYEEIEKFIGKAWSIGTRQPPKRDAEEEVRAADERPHDFFTAPRDQPQFDYKELEGFFANSLPEVKWFRHSVFGGGFIDPTYSKRVRGLNQDRDRDFAIITLAQNPFREKNDGEFPAVILAGYHLPGTCYTLHEHIWSNRGQFFENHPYGGVLRVDLEPLAETHKSFYTFYERMENFVVQWDDESDYNEGELLTAVAEISKKLPDTCHLLLKEAQRLRTFVHHLITPGSEHDMGSETETSLPVSAAQPRRVDRAR